MHDQRNTILPQAVLGVASAGFRDGVRFLRVGFSISFDGYIFELVDRQLTQQSFTQPYI